VVPRYPLPTRSAGRMVPWTQAYQHRCWYDEAGR
jgi:hypothetical protein